MNLADAILGDPETLALIDGDAQIRAMLQVEVALATAQARLGMIPDDAARAIAAAAQGLIPDPDEMRKGTASAGIAAQPVVNALKSACPDHAGHVHFGATSQDIVDSALVLALREALTLLAARLQAVTDTLDRRADDFADQAIPARTRFQNAMPTTLGAKIAVWRAPLVRDSERLEELRPRLLVLSLHGAAGTSAAFGENGPALRKALADNLGLTAPDLPWHATRDTMVELGNWLALVTGSLGKMGADLILMGQSGIGEVMAGAGGASSTMPQKANPVAAEALVSIARLNAGAIGTLHQAMIHAQERDGSALAIEWAVLPDMLVRTGAALRLAQDLVETLRPNADLIEASFATDRGMMMAEAAGFALAREMPRKDALALVARALRAVAEGAAATLPDALDDIAPRDGGWSAFLTPDHTWGEAAAMARSGADKGNAPTT
ncbi:lyase family protein [Paracoccus sp. TK19116]|uniref:Lyase family protein n=1 Tax=Paracoccus albicereus TaxID=2922394 RepID=A0ABT1MU29_9RHOB|nr:lyase family protein [Paracoccus albicereus]MCQ0971634.1 lyase family protein [Paracoccus albicereus]